MYRLVLLCCLAACGTSSTVQSELDNARARWQANRLGVYEFDWRRSCECTTEVTREMHVIVSDETITSLTYAYDGTAVPTTVWSSVETVDGVFESIQDAIDQDAYSIVVTYDGSGYPRDVSIDYSLMIADEEYSAHITDLAGLAR